MSKSKERPSKQKKVKSKMKLNLEFYEALCDEDVGEKIQKLSALLDEGADVNKTYSEHSGFTPLQVASENGDPEVVKFLLSRGADPKIKNEDGRNCPALVTWLLQETEDDVTKATYRAIRDVIKNAVDDKKKTEIVTTTGDTKKDTNNVKKTKGDEMKLGFYVQRTIAHQNRIKAYVMEHALTMGNSRLGSRVGNDDPSTSGLSAKVLQYTVTNEKGSTDVVSFTTDKKIFDELHAEYQGVNNLHLVKETSDGEFVCKDSLGSMGYLLNCIDPEVTKLYAPNRLLNMIERAKKERFVVLADHAGSGKSSFLTYTAHRIQRAAKKPTWVSRVNLREETTALREYENGEISFEEISKKLFMRQNPTRLEMHLFSKMADEGRMVLMFDGLDEISPAHYSAFVKLFTALKDTSVEQIWITTRSHLKKDVIELTHRLPYVLVPFTEDDQREFSRKFYKKKTYKDETVDDEIVDEFCDSLHQLVASSINKETSEMKGTPLEMRMIVGRFERGLKTFVKSGEIDLPTDALSLTDLCENFIENKFRDYNLKSEGVVGAGEIIRNRRLNTFAAHQYVAMCDLYPDEVYKVYDQWSTYEKDDWVGFVRMGMITDTDRGPTFIHNVYAEYFLANFIIDQLHHNTRTSPQGTDYYKMMDFLLSKILPNNKVITTRKLLNEFFYKSNETLSAELLVNWGKGIEDYFLRNPCDTKKLICSLAESESAYLILFLIQSLKRVSNEKLLKELIDDPSVWQTVVGNSSKNILQVFIDEGQKLNLNFEAIINKTNSDSDNLWHIAARKGNVDVLKLVRDISEGTNCTLSYALETKNMYGNTALYISLYFKKYDVFALLLNWCKEIHLEANKTLLHRNRNNNNLLHIAAHKGQKEQLDLLKKITLSANIDLKELLLKVNKYENTVFHLAVYYGNFDNFKLLIEWGRQQAMDLKQLTMTKNSNARNLWHIAAMKGRIKILEFLKTVADEVKLDIRNVFDDVSKLGSNVYHLAIENRHMSAFECLWKWTEDLGSDLKHVIMSSNKEGNNLWHFVAINGSAEIADLLHELSLELNINIHDIFDCTNSGGSNVFHLVVNSGHLELFEKFLEWALAADYSSETIVTRENENRSNLWHLAASKDSVEVLKLVKRITDQAQLEMGKVVATTTKYGNTVYHLSSNFNNYNNFHILLAWGIETGVDFIPLSAKQNVNGNSVWSLAALRGNLRIMKKLVEQYDRYRENVDVKTKD